MTIISSNDYQIIFCTCPNLEVAKKIATHLVESNLAACVNVLPEIMSIYRWENKIEKEIEILLIIKSAKHQYSHLEKCIIELHPYDTPEIIAVPVQTGNEKYLKWINSSLI